MSTVEPSCPKCGGKMRAGEVRISVLQSNPQGMMPFMQQGYLGSVIPPLSDEVPEKLYWEERTGEKKGTFFKRDETRKIAVSGFRCTLCGYVELYAKEK